MHAKTKGNFEIFSAEDFIAAITQHIPDKGFQMVRYYGWYSNRARGERALAIMIAPPGPNLDPRAGFLVWFSQKTGTSGPAADVFSGVSEKQFLIGWKTKKPFAIVTSVV